MKYGFLFFLLCCAAQLLGQTISPLGPIPESGSILGKHWKWQSGDNPAWSAPTFNDQQWKPIDLATGIHELPDLRKAQIGWFRRPIRINAALVNKPLCFYIHQTGASVIFLDGKPLDTLGTVSSSSTAELTYTRPKIIAFSLPDTNLHSIAVRLSFTKGNFYYPGSGRDIFNLKVLNLYDVGTSIQKAARRSSGIPFFSIGLFLVFSILHFAFYVTNRSTKVSLWLGVTMLIFTIAFLSQSQEDYRQSVSGQQVNELITLVTFYLGVLLINVSLYYYLKQPFKYFFYVQVVWMAVGLACSITAVDVPYGLATWPPFLLIFSDFIRVSILAERRKDVNAKVPIYSLVVAAIFLVAILAFVFIINSSFNFKTNGLQYAELIIDVSQLLIFLLLISIPVGLSFSIVLEYSRTQQSLRTKIREIESLSAKNLAQEQEKQQILAAQNETLERQVAERTAELKESIEHLKTTQDQLIQSEKLASLGELTAGIAHEIQNPLNFVNNFSEVSVELLEELREEGPTGELGAELLADIEQNLQKINQHGKRASSIVKGMLEHSRASSGKKEPTDINTLADEYLRLAYHGLRAKDKSFNADFKTDFDKNLPNVDIVSQDISRVLLNLINNAFYAVQQKTLLHPPGYAPVVTVSTQRLNDLKTGHWAEIRVKDNGTGIPEEVQDKIFQPFFTTKPTGQGTGLGLSLAYDIVTKGHGGTLEVQSREGEGTEFIVKLPIRA